MDGRTNRTEKHRATDNTGDQKYKQIILLYLRIRFSTFFLNNVFKGTKYQENKGTFKIYLEGCFCKSNGAMTFSDQVSKKGHAFFGRNKDVNVSKDEVLLSSCRNKPKRDHFSC